MNMKFAIAVMLCATASVAIAQDGAPAPAPESTPPTATPTAPEPTVASPAQPADTRPVLWQNIRMGMTVAEVRALYPERRGVKHKSNMVEIEDFQVVGTCLAEININHPQGIVTTVVAKGEGSMGGRCSDTVMTALSSRYGQPLAREHTSASILAREGQIFVWNRDNITLRFKRFTNGAFGGGGLFNSSWELTYSGVSDDVAL